MLFIRVFCKYFVLVSTFIFTCYVMAETVDPRNKTQWLIQQQNSDLKLSSWPVTRIKQLEQYRDKLKSDIAQLPRHCPIISDNHLGYHSSLNLNNGANVPKVHQIDFTLARPYEVHSIALVPAFYPLRPYGGSYAFPKRFTIEIEEWGKSGFIEIVNWLDEDFPNPGSYPVFFNDINKKFKRLRITAPSHTEDSTKAHFALGEVFIWANDEENGLIENVARASKTQINASSSFDQPAKWHLDYLTDMDTGLGFPIEEQQVEKQDLLIIPDRDNELNKSIIIKIKLSQAEKISRIDFWPAKPSSDIMLPDFGFPKSIRVEVANNATFNKAKIITPESKGEKFGTLFSVRLQPEKLQYIRIQLSDLQAINQQFILGLGEIAIYDANGKLINTGLVNAEGIPDQYLNQLPRLVDGYSWGRRIVPERDWIMGLAQRRPLDQQLNYINNELNLAHDYWEWLLSKMIIGSVIVIFLLLIGAVILFQRNQRQQLLLQQGDRINRDLHDEVGSSLGSITLLADELANKQASSLITDELDDLSLMAREANASLREVVWHSDGKPILLQTLIQTLFERAERILRKASLEKSLPEYWPEIKVSLAVKRHLTLFFKEVIHNCARHAQASQVNLTARIDEQNLWVEIKDNGCGFDQTNEVEGWGLKNLAARAEEISGEIQVIAQLGKGVSVILKVPLNMLTKDLKNGYQTSN